MKDVTKLISDRATRFIPVDMKDRLKTVFNRAGTGKSQPPADDDVPDYSAIFNANKSPNDKKARFNGPLEPAQLSAPQQTKRLSDWSQEPEIIEEAEIVSESSEHPPHSQSEASPAANTRRPAPPKAETPKFEPPKQPKWQPRAPEPPKHAPVAEASPQPHRTAEPPAPGRPSRPEPRGEKKTEAYRPEPRPQAEAPHEDFRPNARFDSSFDSRISETARLKVEPRSSEPDHLEEHAVEEPQPVMASSGYYRAPQSTRPTAETPAKARDAEEHMAAAFSYEKQPLEQPRDTYRAAGLSTPRATETPEPNLHQEKETSMQAKGQESIHENGQAAVRTDSANIASIAIERNSKFSGQLKFSGAVAIDGQVEGEIVAERVVVHEGGVVNATVEGNTIVIAGTVKGDVYARGELEILASGVVHGSVTTPQINVRRGGRIDGRCAIGAPRQ